MPMEPPAAVTRGGRRWWLHRALPGLAAGGAAIGIALIDPTDTGVSICASQRLLGLDCPLCGGLRCVNALLRGDFLAAADHNVIAAVGLPMIAVAWLAWFLQPLTNRRVTTRPAPNWLVGVVAVAMLAFTVARNLGGPAWMQWLASGSYG